MEREIIGAQGEITICRLTGGTMPEGLALLTEQDASLRPIISHSESGHHHVLERPVDVRVSEQDGMRVLYALLDQPTRLLQDAANAHGEHLLEPGLYEFRIAREYDPFADEVRRVAD